MANPKSTASALSRTMTGLCIALGLALPVSASWALMEMASRTPVAGARLPPLPRGSRILAFGDSLTSGVGGSGVSYPQRLTQLIHHEVIDAGVPGEISSQGRARLGSVLRETTPSLVIICLGINDFLQKIAHDKLRENLQAMLDESASYGIPVLLLAIPDPRTRQIDPWFAMLEKPGSVRVDLHAMADVLKQPALKADLVHPDGEGYRKVADAVARSLSDGGALGSGRSK